MEFGKARNGATNDYKVAALRSDKSNFYTNGPKDRTPVRDWALDFFIDRKPASS